MGVTEANLIAVNYYFTKKSGSIYESRCGTTHQRSAKAGDSNLMSHIRVQCPKWQKSMKTQSILPMASKSAKN